MKNDNYSYKPSVGERCLISPPNCDDDAVYVFSEFDILWSNETFVLYGNNGKWPNLHKWSMVAIKPLPHNITIHEDGETACCPSPGNEKCQQCQDIDPKY